MLTHLVIRNFQLIDTLDLPFASGLTVLTGETGAGKSTVIDALKTVLGGQANQQQIRSGQTSSTLSALFQLPEHHPAHAWLAEHDLAEADQCLLKRHIEREGRSKNWINGQLVTARQLRALAPLLVHLHGQHDHLNLLKEPAQRAILDATLNDPTAIESVQSAYTAWHTAANAMAEQAAHAQQASDRQALLQYYLDEYGACELDNQTPDSLLAEHGHLSQVEGLKADVHSLLAVLSEEEGALSTQLGRVLNTINPLQNKDPNLAETAELLDSAYCQVQDAYQQLRDYAAHCEADPARLAALTTQLSQCHALARKHQTTLTDLPEQMNRYASELTALQQQQTAQANQAEQVAALNAAYHNAANTLSELRENGAAPLAESVTTLLRQLGMPHAQFHIAVNTDPSRQQPDGHDHIQFQVSTNPGTPLGSLSQVSSGGELSRMSLALETLTTRTASCLIFDEIDVGISGHIAETIGQHLQQIGQHTQTLCLTHLPQVAQYADHHLRVDKHSQAKQTTIHITALDPEERQAELTRILGDQTLARLVEQS